MLEVISHRGGVCCIAITEENKNCISTSISKSRRTGVVRITCWNIGDWRNSKQAIIRELKEETGYHFVEVESMVDFFPSPGYTSGWTIVCGKSCR